MKRVGTGPRKVSDLFEKYTKTLVAPEGSVISALIEVVFDVTGHTIQKTQVRYTPSTKTLVLKTPSILKSEILLHKEEILIHLKGRLGVKNAPMAIL